MKSIIVAVSDNGAIGQENQLPWRISADLKRFKALTMGHHLVMGRKTFESIGRPLPGRTMVVVTRGEFAADGVIVARSLEEAWQLAAADEEIFVAGGAEIYRQTLSVVDRLYVTEVHATIDGDAWFPPFDRSAWREVSREDHEADEKNEYWYSFVMYERA